MISKTSHLPSTLSTIAYLEFHRNAIEQMGDEKRKKWLLEKTA